jgi:hypothetical protein
VSRSFERRQSSLLEPRHPPAKSRPESTEVARPLQQAIPPFRK